MIAEFLTKKALDVTFNAAKNALARVLKDAKGKFVLTRDEFEQSLKLHLTEVENWSSQVSFSDLSKAKYLSDIFIELDLFVYPRRIRIHPSETIKSIPLEGIFDHSDSHIVLLGQPGAGKTTSMKRLCQLLLHDRDFYPDRFNFPILVKLRELNNLTNSSQTTLVIDQIYQILGLSVELPQQANEKERESKWKDIKQKVVTDILNELRVLLILDGFDELVNSEDREEAVSNSLCKRSSVFRGRRLLFIWIFITSSRGCGNGGKTQFVFPRFP